MGFIFSEIRHLRVLMMDGDFRRSSLAKMINMKKSPGLADVLAGTADYKDVIQQTPIPNLYLISAGSTGNFPAAQLLSSSSSQKIFAKIRNQFHYTIVDTPPAMTVTDAGIIGQMCDGVIVIVKLNYTHENTARSAVRTLRSDNVPLLGVMVIGRDRPNAGYGYGYGYGYYRSYYDHYYDYYEKGDKSKSKDRV